MMGADRHGEAAATLAAGEADDHELFERGAQRGLEREAQGGVDGLEQGLRRVGDVDGLFGHVSTVGRLAAAWAFSEVSEVVESVGWCLSLSDHSSASRGAPCRDCRP